MDFKLVGVRGEEIEQLPRTLLMFADRITQMKVFISY